MLNEIHADRYLFSPGHAPAERNVSIPFKIAGEQRQKLNARSTLIMPAPVNAHDHGYGIRTIDFAGYDDALEVWSPSLAMRPNVDPYLKATVAFGRLVSSGVCSTMHCHNASSTGDLVEEAGLVIQAAKDVGIHLAFSCPLIDSNPWVYDGPNALKPHMSPSVWESLSHAIPKYKMAKYQIAAVEAIAANHHGPGADIQYGPIGPQWCSEELLGLIADGSKNSGRRIHMHLLETERQRLWLDQKYPQGIIPYLDSIGFLSPRLSVAHGVQLRPEECDLMAERGVIVVSNPSANLRLRSGIAPVHDFRTAGLKYAIGLDGTGLDDDQDYWREIRLFYLLHGGRSLVRETSAQEVFDAAIHVGSQVVNRPKRNDCVLINYDALTKDAIFDDLEETEVILTRMTRQYVAGLIVDGKWVVENGKTVNIDLDECKKELRKQARSLSSQIEPSRNSVRQLQVAIRRYYAS